MNLSMLDVRHRILLGLPINAHVGTIILHNNTLEEGEGCSASVCIYPSILHKAAYTASVPVYMTDSAEDVAERILTLYLKWFGEKHE